MNDCKVSPFWRSRLVDLINKYECVFSWHSLDCGEAKRFCHRIRLTDDKPFGLPYRRLSPAHYLKLKQTLDEMEQKKIIRKSSSEFASLEKNGDLRLCTAFQWLNARTVRDAHPFPNQADVLAALGGNALFSTMDLTSRYYNILCMLKLYMRRIKNLPPSALPLVYMSTTTYHRVFATVP